MCGWNRELGRWDGGRRVFRDIKSRLGDQFGSLNKGRT